MTSGRTYLIIQAKDLYRYWGRGKWKEALKEMRKGDNSMLCKERGYRTEYIVESSIYSGEYLWGIMYNALSFNNKSWHLACPLSWRCNIFNHHQKSVKNRKQVARFILSLKQQLEFWLEKFFKKGKIKKVYQKSYCCHGHLTATGKLILQQNVSRKKFKRFAFDRILVFTAKHRCLCSSLQVK